MKDIKSYVIGFLTCACLFLIMGQTKSDKWIEWDDERKQEVVNMLNQLENKYQQVNKEREEKQLKTHIGRYQGYGYDDKDRLIDTRTGQMYFINTENWEWVELKNTIIKN